MAAGSSKKYTHRLRLESRSRPAVLHRGLCHLNPRDPFYTAFSFASLYVPGHLVDFATLPGHQDPGRTASPSLLSA